MPYCTHLVPFFELWLMFIICIGGLWKAVGWIFNMVMVHGHCIGVSYVVGGCNLIATKHGICKMLWECHVDIYSHLVVSREFCSVHS